MKYVKTKIETSLKDNLLVSKVTEIFEDEREFTEIGGVSQEHYFKGVITFNDAIELFMNMNTDYKKFEVKSFKIELESGEHIKSTLYELTKNALTAK